MFSFTKRTTYISTELSISHLQGKRRLMEMTDLDDYWKAQLKYERLF